MAKLAAGEDDCTMKFSYKENEDFRKENERERDGGLLLLLPLLHHICKLVPCFTQSNGV